MTDHFSVDVKTLQLTQSESIINFQCDFLHQLAGILENSAKEQQKTALDIISKYEDIEEDDFKYTWNTAISISTELRCNLLVSLYAFIEKNIKFGLNILDNSNKGKYKWNELRDTYNTLTCKNFEELPHYPEINAIRLLNNCFKHNDNKLEQKYYHYISKEIILNWELKIDKENNYEKISWHDVIEHAVDALRVFYNSLLSSYNAMSTGGQ